MSSEGNGPGSGVGADDAPQPDPWFEPAPRADRDPSGNGGHPAAEWFLRAGRAGLLPDSMTVSPEDADAAPEWRHEAEGAPPWAAEQIQTDGEPPPWERGPWPGPGEDLPGPRGGDGTGGAAGAPAARLGWGSAAGEAGNWQSRAALVTGILPLVVPGIVLGALGLRRARSSGSGSAASWLGIALSVAWALILWFVVIAPSGSPAGGCPVPSAVHASYAQVMKDLSSRARGAGLATDVRAAASHANDAAAYASQVPLRNALFALAADLEGAQAELAAGKTIPASVTRRLAADAAALTTSCAS